MHTTRTCWPAWIAGFSLVLAGAALAGRSPVRAADVPQAEEAAVDAKIAALIGQLGAEDFAAREAAQAELAQLGLEAFDALHAAQNHSDPEIALRARYLVRSMGVRWFQESDSPDVVRILKGYGDLSDSERRNRMDRLASLEGAQGVAPLCRLSRFETIDPLSKYAALKVMDQPAIADAAERASLVKTITSIVGNSKRPAAAWLRLYARTVAEPAAALPDWDEATKLEHETLDKHPDRTNREIVRDLYRWQVELLKRLGRDDDAVGVIRRTFSLLDGTPEQLTEIVDWLFQRGAWDVVLEVAAREQFVAVFNDNPLLLYRLAETQLALKRDAEAKATAERALALRADNLDEHFRIGFVLQERGLMDWAEREYRAVMAASAPASVLDFRSRFYLSELLHDQVKELAAGETLKPVCDLMVKDEAHKDTCVRASREPAGVISRMHFFFACHLVEQRDFAAAEKRLDQAIESDPTDADVLIALYRLPNPSAERREKTKELIDEAAKDFRDQIEEARQAADQAPTEAFQAQANLGVAQGCNQLAWLVGNTEGDYDEALKCSLRSLEIRPDYPGYLDTLGRCYYAKGDLANAIKYQSQAVKLDPHTGAIRRQLEFFQKELAKTKEAGK
ncbi:MAG: tetratricopeptide repeat protein [Pirellulaceae bacterium]|nr:tetratricopeptide repeat protein [Pirellulaceae bacterium]